MKMKKRPHSEIAKETRVDEEFSKLKDLQPGDDNESGLDSEEEFSDDECAIEGGSDDEIIEDDDEEDDDNDDESEKEVIELDDSDEDEDVDDDDEKEDESGGAEDDNKAEPSTSGIEETKAGSNDEEKEDEYKEDSSDEEDARNTIGNIPIEWYKEKGHVGYGLDGKKIMKDWVEEGDELDELIMKMDDPNYWRQVRDPQTGKKVVLSDDDIKLIRRYMRGRYATKPKETIDPFSETFVREEMKHPVTNQMEHKRSFIPSKWERLKVSQIVHSIKMGWMKVPDKKSDDEEEDEDKLVRPKFYDIWGVGDEPQGPKRIHQYIAPPKMELPGHYESYNPPEEYLFTPEEEKKWLEKEPSERRLNFIPRKYPNLRSVRGYERFVKERFERCLDLYMCPRQIKMRAKVSLEDLLPKLPSPRDLLPFPTMQALLFRGHTDIVRSIAFDPSGLLLASGSDDATIRIWEVRTGRCLRVFETDGPVKQVKWNPKKAVLIAAEDRKVLVLSTDLANREDPFEDLTEEPAEEKEEKIPVKWEVKGSAGNAGIRMVITHPQTVTHLSWQKGGDYFSTVLADGKSLSVLIHRLSSRTTMKPFEKIKGHPQCVQFHPSKPLLYVASKQSVKSYNLSTAKSGKKLYPNCQWISSMSIHPKGENIIVGSYDNRITWFDTEQSTKPYKVLKYHKSAVRQVTFHNTLPLFASCSDDGAIRITHATVYNDLMSQPMIVPVKRLGGHVKSKNLCVLDCQFHPKEPIVVTAGADKTIRLFI